MKHSIPTLLAGLAMAAVMVTPVLAADVKVALLDVSSVMPTGMQGYGMMYPGMMGQGFNGQGMMGQGFNRQGMMGYGMMGRGMMGGMMSIRIDQTSIKTGPVKFEVTNWSRSVVHEMLIVSVDNPNTPLPYDYAQARVPEDQVKVLGEVPELQPSASKDLEVTLEPGAYLLICNVAGHYAAGMVTAITVTQ